MGGAASLEGGGRGCGATGEGEPGRAARVQLVLAGLCWAAARRRRPGVREGLRSRRVCAALPPLPLPTPERERLGRVGRGVRFVTALRAAQLRSECIAFVLRVPFTF